MLKQLLTVLFFASILVQNSASQTTKLNYIIEAAFFDIGSYKIEREIKGDTTFYYAVSDVSVSYLLSRYEVQFITKSKFYKDTLMVCHVDVIVDGKIRESNHTEYIEGNYKIHRVEEDGNVRDEWLNTPAIFVTSSMLFFNEPDGTSKYAQNYAELYGWFNKMENTSTGSHNIIDKKTGRITTYNYKNGEVVSTEIDYPLLTFGLEKAKN